MAYPPPVLATNRTNATAQQDNHIADHNGANQAINDTVAKLGPDPAGGSATTTTKLQAIDQSIADVIANTSAALAGIKNPNWVDAIDHTNGNTGFAIAAASTVVTTNTGGDFSINFLPMFAAKPIVVVGSDVGLALIVPTNFAASTASMFAGRALYADSGNPAGSATLRVNWIAIGRK